MTSVPWLQAQILEAIEQVLRGGRPEDSRLELKSGEVSNIPRTARQLAAHANAARGEPLVWIVGLNERDRLVDGAQIGDFAEWISKIESWFNGSPPHVVLHRYVAHEGKDVLGIVFDTKAAPFVVKNPSFGIDKENVEFEVPWRYGTRAQSAKKSELLRLLVPLTELPECELVDCRMLTRSSTLKPRSLTLTLEANVYIIARGGSKLIVPLHRCACRFRVAGDAEWIYLAEPRATTIGQSTTVTAGTAEAVINGAGMVQFTAQSGFSGEKFRDQNLEVAVEIGTSLDRERVTLHETLVPAPPHEQRPAHLAWLRAD